MLPKKQKLTKSDFSALKKRGKTLHSLHFTLTAYDTIKTKNNKFSFVVSKKVSKKSVVRNKLKRIGYDTIRSLVSRIKEKSVFCVFFLKNGAEKTSPSQLSNEISELLKKAGVLS